MHTQSTSFSRITLGAWCLAALLAAPVAMAAGAGSPAPANSDIEARYTADVARCNAGQINQDKTTCLREAGAARNEARRNRLSSSNQAYEQNEIKRCQALPVGERDDCMLQMSGQNTVTKGSVGSGGVLRETTITTPATPETSTGVNTGSTPEPVPAIPAPATVPGTGIVK
ncbi:hypothetical protein EKL30_01125 [Candidimonas sp. SYP-B2681]|uniref:hypothetical protein n=1 Tax=Candidimonas sp. SYP-B2681 TaxID=2497686 RepID=UPI000F87EF85|nr:hypothetical protein [Candidimonas sp. SYP-B2681]RTZ47633.1 hypothetical protein EKL30_01125 [Candidimonas sp. SYP-B2681]